jgi:hypothetical protein
VTCASSISLFVAAGSSDQHAREKDSDNLVVNWFINGKEQDLFGRDLLDSSTLGGDHSSKDLPRRTPADVSFVRPCSASE